MLKAMKEKVIQFGKKSAGKVTAATLALGSFLSVAAPTFAAPATGNADLDAVLTQLNDGATSMKTGALWIIGAVILIAIGIFGIRWIWGIFRGWMSMAK